MSDKIEDQNPDSLIEVESEISDEHLTALEQKVAEIARLFEETREKVAAVTTPTVEQQWMDAVNEMINTKESSVWLRDADIKNFVSAGEIVLAHMSVADFAWMIFHDEHPTIHHRYEVEFYENGLRGSVYVTFTIGFAWDDLTADVYEMAEELEGRFDLFDRRGLYRHSWPYLKKFIEKTIDDFWWGPIDFPEKKLGAATLF